ncbi:hypothetical protein [Ethanoligenens sp.]|uniref:hypothetical protein n=1 Tax=Ethanoligenens sp. TaxID=2099655 RepID=UPI0039E86A13
MTVNAFIKILACNEPDFSYNGQNYSICWPDGKYYVTAEDSPNDVDLVFQDVDDLLDHWIIQGQPLRLIIPKIDLG